MRIESSVTSLSWIPSEAVTGLNKAVFGSGFTHYDDPPPDVIGDLEALRDDDRFRFANHLVGWIEFDGERIVDAGYGGGCLMGATTVAVGGKQASFAAVAFDDIRRDDRAHRRRRPRFVQTVGGHTAVPAPRRVSKPPFVKFEAPTVWSTLSLTIHADGTSEFELARREHVPPPLGVRRVGQARRQGRARPTSRTGGGMRSASTRRGATRTRRRW